jgi:NTE family protein
LRFFPLSLLLIVLCGCAHYPLNAPLQQIDLEAGYRLSNRTLGERNSDELFVVLGLSGGGARAMAMDYGMLKFLDRVRFGADRRSLLDELDMISTSSAASVPAAYYGLFGKRAFLEEFADNVLYRPVQSDLIRRGLNPGHWPRLASSRFSRGDLAVEYFDRIIFQEQTFANMRQERPFILLNATDMGIGSQLSFVQTNFDLLCSDLSTFPVARAVTASMAYTPGFTPITLKNYNDGSCGYTTPKWALDALNAGIESDPYLFAAANDVLSYENIEKRPYIHLLDSGLSDNIGIRSPSLYFSVEEEPASQIDRVRDGTIKKLVVILVNAKSKTFFQGDLKPNAPGAITSVSMAASTPLANYSYETVNLLKRDIQISRKEVERFHRLREACDAHADRTCMNLVGMKSCHSGVRSSCYTELQVADDTRPTELDIYIIHISFDLIDDQQRRYRYQSIPTALQLPREDVDALIEVIPELTMADPEFRHLLQDLEAQVVIETETGSSGYHLRSD